MASKKISTWVSVSTAEDMRRLSKIKKRSMTDMLRELTYDFLKRNAARLAQIKDVPPNKAELGTAISTAIDEALAQDFQKLANADDLTPSELLRAETEKYVADNRELLEK